MTQPSGTTVTFSIISHTNIGKTTLARTLLRQDVGEVAWRDHVTLDAESYVMLEAGGDQLVLWDTPGFGGVDARHLLKRLKAEGTAAGWLMHTVVDRLRNPSLYSSVEAARNIRRHADIVLYLVNARENPEDADYARIELELIEALNVPTVLVLNQVRRPPEETDHRAWIDQMEASWRTAFASSPAVQGVFMLDAFSRTWMQELRLMHFAADLLPDEKKHALKHLGKAWEQHSLQIVDTCAAAVADMLLFALRQRMSIAEKVTDEEAFSHLHEQLQDSMDNTVEAMIRAYNLEADALPDLRSDISALEGLGKKRIDEHTVGWLSAALSGAGGGLAADAATGGLSFGGGAVLGFILGGIGGFFAARGFNLFNRHEGEIRWGYDFIKALFNKSLFFFLLIAHHGRGKGMINFDERMESWNKAIEAACRNHSAEIDLLLQRTDASWIGPTRQQLAELFSTVAQESIHRLYPD